MGDRTVWDTENGAQVPMQDQDGVKIHFDMAVPGGDLELVRVLLAQAAIALDRTGKANLAGSIRAIGARIDEPASLPLRPPDLWEDVRRSIAGLIAVCLAQGFSYTDAVAFTDACASDLADHISGAVAEVSGG